MTRFITKIAVISVLALSALTMTAPVVQAQTTTTSTSRFDKTRFPEERKAILNLNKDFPRLGEEFEVLGKSTGHVDKSKSTDIIYNCIAWSVGITGHWEWPSEFRTVDGKKVQYTNVKLFDNFYKKHGYTRLALRDITPVAGKHKVTLFGRLNSAGEIEVTHASRQESDNTWSSKLGGLALIKHRLPQSLTGPCYGEPIAVYVKNVATPSIAGKVVGTWTANIAVNGEKGVEAIALLDDNRFGIAKEFENGKKSQYGGTYTLKGNVVEFTPTNGTPFQARVNFQDANRITLDFDKTGSTIYARFK